MAAIPLFPVRELEPLLAFYEALGFEVTYRQDEPYIYASVQLADVQVHFAELNTGPKPSVGRCLVMARDVSLAHERFASRLRFAYGKVPLAGEPRITRMRTGATRFHLVDPAGNTMTWIDQAEEDVVYEWAANRSPLLEALEQAEFFRDVYILDRQAAGVLRAALRKHPDGETIDRARVVAALAELCVALGNEEETAAVRGELSAIELSPAEREEYEEELEASERLERWMVEG